MTPDGRIFSFISADNNRIRHFLEIIVNEIRICKG
jgi:hypothetical protein